MKRDETRAALLRSMPLYDALTLLASEAPGYLTLNDSLGRVDRAEMIRHVDQGRRVLRHAGQDARSRVAVVSRSAQALARLLPSIACHSTVMPIDPALRCADVANLLRRAGATLGRFEYLDFARWARESSATEVGATPLILTELVHAQTLPSFGGSSSGIG